jgi:hypothetical protein
MFGVRSWSTDISLMQKELHIKMHFCNALQQKAAEKHSLVLAHFSVVMQQFNNRFTNCHENGYSGVL